MKKTALLSVITLLGLAVFGCGGGGSDITFSDLPANNKAPAVGTTTSRTVDTDGGEVPLGNFTATFPADTFGSSATVTVTSLGSEPAFATQGSLVGSAIHVEVNGAAKQAGQTRRLAQSSATPIISFSATNGDDLLLIRKGTLSIGGETFIGVEYPMFITSSGTDSSGKIQAVDNFFSFGSSVTYALLSIQDRYQLVPEASLVRFDTATRTEIADGALNGRIPIILIHGYNEQEYVLETGEQGPWYSLYKERVWENFYDKLQQNELEPLTGNLQVYEFIYPTWKEVAHNGQELLQLIQANDYLKDSDSIIMVAHSMGGLVGRQALESGLGDQVKKVITLGTPHHGSILASFKYLLDSEHVSLGDLPALAGNLLTYYTNYRIPADTPGFRDLCWDNYDNAISTTVQNMGMRVNDTLLDFNNASLHTGKLLAVAGVFRSEISDYGLGYSLMKDFSGLWNGRAYESDGRVTIDSASMQDRSIESLSYTNHSHADIYQDSVILQQVLSGVSNIVSESGGEALPAAPAVVFARAVDALQFTLTWSSVSNADSYRIYLDGEYNTAVMAPVTSTTFTGLLPDTVYTVAVAAVNEDGEGSQSTSLEVTTGAGEDLAAGTWSGTFDGDAEGTVTFAVELVNDTVTGTFVGSFVKIIDEDTYNGTFSGILTNGVITDGYHIQCNLSGSAHFTGPEVFEVDFVEDESSLTGDFENLSYNGTWITTTVIDESSGTWTAERQ